MEKLRTTLRQLSPPPVFWWTLAVVAFAWFVRSLGLDAGLPYGWHPDEPHIMTKAIRMLQKGELEPGFYRYPPLYTYIQMLGVSAKYLLLVKNTEYFTLASVDTGESANLVHIIGNADLWLVGRQITAMFGALAAGFTYLAGRKLYDDRVGLVAAFVLAMSPINIRYSHFIKVDVPTGAMVAATLLASAWILREGARRHFVLASLAFGLVVALKYNSVWAIVMPLTAWALAWERRDERMWWGMAILPLGMVVFGLTMFPALFNLPVALADIGGEVNHYMEAGHGSETVEPGLPHLLGMVGGMVTRGMPVWLLMVLPGLYLGARREWRALVLALVYPVVYMLFMSSSRVMFFRNLIPAQPGLCILIGLGTVGLFDLAATRWPTWRKGFLALTAIFLLAPAYYTKLEVSGFLNGVDSRTEMTDWLRSDEAPRKAVIAVPTELFLAPSTLHGFDMVWVSMVDSTPDDWVKQGATHALGGRNLQISGSLGGGEARLRIDEAAAWFQSHKAVQSFGRPDRDWTINKMAVNPYIGLYALPTKAAHEDASATPAADLSDWRSTWTAQPETTWDREVQVRDRTLVVQRTEEFTEKTRLCLTQPVPVQPGLQVKGRLRSNDIRLGDAEGQRGGARIDLAFLDPKSKPMTGPQTRVTVHTAKGTSDWVDLAVPIEIPPGAAFARPCVTLAVASGSLEIETLSITDAR